jgi:tetratricopeptide (TPR) repeat protein
MSDQSVGPPHRGYIPPPRLAEVGADSNLAAYLRALVILASPAISNDPPLDLRAEWQAIAAAISRHAGPLACYRLMPPTWDALLQALARPGAWPVVHISAHGNEEGVLLEDEYGNERFVSSEQLAKAFIGSQVRLVILNACSSRNPAAALVGAGVPAVMATTAPISDDEARLLAEHLYAGLSGGRTIKDSLDFARRVLSSPDTFVVYAQSDNEESVLCPEPELGRNPLVSTGFPPRSAALPSNFAFLGRGRELVDIAYRLADSHIRAICITGLGGFGKTTLASEVAHRQGWRFPDGVVWVNAEDVPNPGLSHLLRHIDVLLGLDISDQPLDLQANTVMEALQHKACLLIVDSLDEIREDKRRELIHFLRGLEPWGRSKAILISRLVYPETESLEGSYHRSLGGLSEGNALRKLAAEAQRRNVFSLLAASNHERLELVRAIDCNPVMIEWMTGLQDIARIRHIIRTLPSTYRAKTNALLESSLRALTPSGQTLLLRFPLFVGSADYSAVRALCGDDVDADMSLDELRTASLVRQDRGRYSLHHLVVDYVTNREDWKASDKTTWRERLAQYYLSLTREQYPRLKSPDFRHALTVLDADWPNLLAAQQYLAVSESLQSLKLFSEFQTVLDEYYHKRGLWDETVPVLKTAIETAYTVGTHTEGLGRLEIQLANLYRRQLGDLDAALEYHQRGLNHLYPSGVPLDSSAERIYRHLGDIYRVRGQFKQALDNYARAQGLVAEENDPGQQGKLLSSMTEAYARLAKLERALDVGQKSLALQYKATGSTDEKDPYEIVQSHRMLADVHLSRGEMAESAEHIHEARQMFEEAGYGHNPIMGWIMRTEGELNRLNGDMDRALSCFYEALTLFQKRGIRVGVAVISEKLGLLHLQRGQFETALDYLNHAVEKARAINGARYALATTLLSRVEAGLIAERHTDYAPYLNELTELLKDDNLIVLRGHLVSLLRSRLDVGVATSVSAVVDFDPIDTLEYATQNNFQSIQVYLNEKIIHNRAFRQELVERAHSENIRLMCHAPDLLRPGPAIDPATSKAARGILRNDENKWVVHHFDQVQPLDETIKWLEGLVKADLIPCIENYHQRKGPEKARQHYEHYLRLFHMIQERGLNVWAVLDVHRLFDAKLGLSSEEGSELLMEVFHQLDELKIPILLHLIDSRRPDGGRKHWCSLGDGIVPYYEILKQVFASTAQVGAAIFEFEDKRNPLESRKFLEKCIRAGLELHQPALTVKWWG